MPWKWHSSRRREIARSMGSEPEWQRPAEEKCWRLAAPKAESPSPETAVQRHFSEKKKWTVWPRWKKQMILTGSTEQEDPAETGFSPCMRQSRNRAGQAGLGFPSAKRSATAWCVTASAGWSRRASAVTFRTGPTWIWSSLPEGKQWGRALTKLMRRFFTWVWKIPFICSRARTDETRFPFCYPLLPKVPLAS